MQEQLYWSVVPTKPYRLPQNHEPFVSPRVLAEPVKDENVHESRVLGVLWNRPGFWRRDHSIVLKLGTSQPGRRHLDSE